MGCMGAQQPRAELGKGATAHQPVLAMPPCLLPPPLVVGRPQLLPVADPFLFPSPAASHPCRARAMGYWARQTRPLAPSLVLLPSPSPLPTPIPISWVTQPVGTLNPSHHLAWSPSDLIILSAATSHRRQQPFRKQSPRSRPRPRSCRNPRRDARTINEALSPIRSFSTMLGMCTLRRHDPFLSRFRQFLVAGLLLISSSAALNVDGTTFLYPLGGESFYNLDTVKVTYESTFLAPVLYTFCAINGVTTQSTSAPSAPLSATLVTTTNCALVQVQDAEPDNASTLVRLNVTTNVPCWFDLRAGQVAGEGATTEKWTALARSQQETTWSGTALPTSTPTSSSRPSSHGPPPDPHDLNSGAKVGIAIAVALGIIAIFTMGLWMWWRRRQKRKVAKNMVNFVDGDIVNLVDGGRFEKRTKPPEAYYDPYLAASSQSTISHSTHTPNSAYHSSPVHEYQQPVQQQYYAEASASHERTSAPILPSETIPPAPAVTNENGAWSNAARHPWSPPDYDAHSPASEWSVQGENDFYAVPQRTHSMGRDFKSAQPVEALPAILPEPKPQAELPDNQGYHARGDEQELPAPHQAPPSRNAPPNGLEIEEQKFLLADILELREAKSKAAGHRSAG